MNTQTAHITQRCTPIVYCGATTWRYTYSARRWAIDTTQYIIYIGARRDAEEEREYFSAVYGRELTYGDVNEIMRPLVGYFKLLIETQKESMDESRNTHQQ